jgi:choline dehydrogenase-like flavoprotein
MLDVLIIGSGAGGGALAWRLATAGCKVLVLERGPRFSRHDYRHEPGGLRPGQFVPSPQVDPHLVVTAKTTTPLRTNLGWIATCVGGGTVHMGGYFYRFHPDDFRLRSRFGDYLEIADWPYGYDELEPYYAQAERLIGVAGLAGADPGAGRRSTPYPLPPLDAHAFAEPLSEACARRGWQAFPTPRAIASRPYDGRPGCAYCKVCASYGCPVGARGTAQETLIAHAERTGNCEVRPLSMVREIVAGDGDRVAGCHYFDAEGQEHFVEARTVCVCASAIESARLLLLSRSPRWPDGLGNGEGLVGRHLQFHAVTMGQALFDLEKAPGDLLRDPHPMLGRSLSAFYYLPDGVSDLAKGGMIRFGIAPQVPGVSPFQPTNAQRVLYFEAFHDFLPNTGTFVELDQSVRDPWGLPVARIRLEIPAHHRRAGRFLADRAFEVYEDLGASEGVTTDVGGTSTYLVHGTCRAGHDAATSVLDPFCRVHGCANLFVVDGSFLPTSGGASTTLTILANALRTADHLHERSKRQQI